MRRQRCNQKYAYIKLEKWQVPYLLGATRLGIRTEDWCAYLVQTCIGTYDTDSAKWILAVGHIIDSVKHQTGVTDEEKEYGYSDPLEKIENMVNDVCDKNLKYWESRCGAVNNEDNKKDKVAEITDEMTEEINKFALKVDDRKK